MHFESLTSATGIFLVNIVAASVVLGAIGLFSRYLARHKPLPFQQAILYVALLLTVASPLLSSIAILQHWGLVTIGSYRMHRELHRPTNQSSGMAVSETEMARDSNVIAASTTVASDADRKGLGIQASRSLFNFFGASVLGRKFPNVGALSDVGVWLATIWGAGIVLSLFRLARGFVVVERLRRSLRVATNCRLLRAAENAVAASGLSATTLVYESALAPVPLTIGWWRCAIVIPEGVAEALDDRQLACVLAHEAAHISRRDTLFAMFQQIVEAVFWWNPFIRAVNQRIDLLREQICDDHVVKHFGEGMPLAHAIVKVVEWSCARSAPLPLVAPLLDDYEAVEQRIHRLSDSDRKVILGLNTSTAVLICVFALVLSIVPFVPILRPQILSAAPDDTIGYKAGWRIRIRAVDDEGRPISNPRIGTQFSSRADRAEWHDGDQNGEIVLTLPNRLPPYCYLFARATGYTPMRAFWSNRNDKLEDALPEEFTFEMAKSTQVRGTVMNESGQPVAGATVRFSAGDFRLHGLRRAELNCYQEKCVTDNFGKWRCEAVPQTATSASIIVTHPDYAVDTNNYAVEQTMDDLRDFKHSWTLRRGFSITGRVVNTRGEPIEGAALAICELNSANSAAIQRTGADGKYQFLNVSRRAKSTGTDDPIALTLTVVKPGYRPVMERVPGFGKRQLGDSTERERKVDFTLQPGVTLSFRVVDALNQPIQNAWVNPMNWHDTPALQTLRECGIPDRTDENGVWRWTDAPPGEIIGFAIEMKGFSRVQDRRITVEIKGNEVPITMKRPQFIAGSVVDRMTKKPIGHFVVDRAFENVAGHSDGLSWTSADIQGKDGKYRGVITMPPSNGNYTYRVRAEGYETAQSASTPFEEGEKIIDFELSPLPRE